MTVPVLLMIFKCVVYSLRINDIYEPTIFTCTVFICINRDEGGDGMNMRPSPLCGLLPQAVDAEKLAVKLPFWT